MPVGNHSKGRVAKRAKKPSRSASTASASSVTTTTLPLSALNATPLLVVRTSVSTPGTTVVLAPNASELRRNPLLT